MTTERPILFSSEMIRAILDGRKTQTRRVVKPQPLQEHNLWWDDDGDPGDGSYLGVAVHECDEKGGSPEYIPCPYGVPGDRLWVRETFQCDPASYERHDTEKVFYQATMPPGLKHLRPSIFMPRWASRITLEVTGVRVERVQEISEKDAVGEGLYVWQQDEDPDGQYDPRTHYGIKIGDVWETDPRFTFRRLWDSINVKRGFGWDVNPWVWVVEFKRLPDAVVKEEG